MPAPVADRRAGVGLGRVVLVGETNVAEMPYGWGCLEIRVIVRLGDLSLKKDFSN